MQFELTQSYLEDISSAVASNNDQFIREHICVLHPADLAEIFDKISLDEVKFIYHLLDEEKQSDTLVELEEDVREQFLESLTSKEIAEQVDNMDTDDAADVIGELSEEQQEEVISHLEDDDHSSDIVDLLTYDEDTAGGLMAKELIKANINWPVNRTVIDMRRQAKDIDRVHSIYVVDDANVLKGVFSLKSLLFTSPNDVIRDIYMEGAKHVHTSATQEEVMKTMEKYDLVVLPVVGDNGELVGRITIDDVVDVIKEEAEKDYQMAAGISQDVDADDSIAQQTKARLPWLILGLFGGLGAVFIMEGFEEALVKYKQLFFFTPLIAAMAGNVGVQSSAIIVQGIANDNLTDKPLKRLVREVSLSLINGTILGLLVILAGYIFNFEILFSVTVAISMLCVIIVAALIGTFIPLLLNKKGIDPALATGPFITTSNDIFGIFIFFYIAKLILGF